VCMIVAVSLDELRQARCYDEDSQCDDTCSQLYSDSELSLPQRKVGLHHIINGSLWPSGNRPDYTVSGPRIKYHHEQPL